MPLLTSSSRRFVRTMDYTYPQRRSPRSGIRERVEVVPPSSRGGWRTPAATTRR